VKVLAIETSTPASSVALADDRRVVATAAKVDRTGHASFLVPAIDFCFDQVGWLPQDLDAVVVDIGPGLYTGIRVGIATAQGLAASLGVPVVAALSLDAIAHQATTGHRHIWAVVDVRRGELAVASYQPVPGGVIKDGPPELLSPDHLRARLESDPTEVLIVGDAPAIPGEVLRGLHRVRIGRPRYPPARALVEIGMGRLDRDRFLSPDEVRPLYLREPDVSLNWEKLRPEGPWSA
jgi:tRNA threonylcarbamoyladenosine biosynthesis protein TsaB